jgi:hypothetical protein
MIESGLNLHWIRPGKKVPTVLKWQADIVISNISSRGNVFHHIFDLLTGSVG